MSLRAQDGQAAIEAIAGAAILIALAGVVVQMLMILAAAGALQSETREAAVREARQASAAGTVVRSRSISGVVPGVTAFRLTARASVDGSLGNLEGSDMRRRRD